MPRPRGVGLLDCASSQESRVAPESRRNEEFRPIHQDNRPRCNAREKEHRQEEQEHHTDDGAGEGAAAAVPDTAMNSRPPNANQLPMLVRSRAVNHGINPVSHETRRLP
jgi:hypothetical protein